MPTPRPRALRRLRLTVTEPIRAGRGDAPVESVPLLPWPVAAASGGLVAALAGWLLVTGVAMVAWFTAMAMAVPQVLRFSSQVWLLAHGGRADLGGVQVSLIPLGLTLLCAILVTSAAGYAGRQALLARTVEPSQAERGTLALMVAGVVTAGYVAVAAVMAWTTSGAAAILAPAAGALLVAAPSALLGAALGLAVEVRRMLPDLALRLVRGTGATLAALVAVGGVVLATGVILGAERMAAIEDSLGLDGAGRVVWATTVLFYLPNLLVWAASWALGPGFTLGSGTLISLSGTQVGMLPALPVLGAVPVAEVAGPSMPAWLAGGVVAGVVAGVVPVRRGRGRLRVVPAVLLGGGSGLLAGLLMVAAAALSRGDLGGLRMVGLGPRIIEALIMIPPALALLGSLAALATCFVESRRPLPPDPASLTTVRDIEATVLLPASATRGRGSAD